MTDSIDRHPPLTAQARQAQERYEALPARCPQNCCQEHAPADLRRLAVAAADPEPNLRAHARATAGLRLLESVSDEVRTLAGPSLTYLQEDWQDTVRHTERLVTDLFGDTTALQHDEGTLKSAHAYARGRIEVLQWEARTRRQLTEAAEAAQHPTAPKVRRRWWARSR